MSQARSRSFLLFKRGFDITAALLGLALTLLPMVFAAIAIKLSSPGPVLFRTQRAGRNNQPFEMFKLRTMTHRRDLGPAVTSNNDARVTGIGKILRKTKLDELPQLWNVLRADMSIVGPRPEDWRIVQQYYSDLDRKLLETRPGIACPGQIYYYLHQANEAPPEGTDSETFYVSEQLPIKLAYDMDYVKKASLWYDMKVILQTATAIACVLMSVSYPWRLTRDEAYDLTPRVKRA